MIPITTFAFTGYANAGKDTCAEIIRKQMPEIEWHIISFSDPLYDSLIAINPIVQYEEESTQWSWLRMAYVKTKTARYERLTSILKRHNNDRTYVKNNYTEVRRLLQELGTAGGRYIHGHGCWVEIMRKRICNILSRAVARKARTGIIFVNIRFTNELYLARELLGGALFYVMRPGIDKPMLGHESDINVDRIKIMADASIINHHTDTDPIKNEPLIKGVEKAVNGTIKYLDTITVLERIREANLQDM